MNIDEIKNRVESYVQMALNGQESEDPKFDFKSVWYDLTNTAAINEFLKDTSAIVNTIGPDGFLAIGFNPKTKKFTSSVFSDSKLKDSTELAGIVAKRMDRLFTLNYHDITIDGKKLSVIHLPPSIDKPHVIRSYVTFDKKGNPKPEENKIFVRRVTGIGTPSKFDLDAMYYDRKNILPEYEIEISIHAGNAIFEKKTSGQIIFTTKLTCENSGRRPLAISTITLNLELNDGGILRHYSLKTGASMLGRNILIQPDNVFNGELRFNSVEILSGGEIDRSDQIYLMNHDKDILSNSLFALTLSNGKVLQTNPVVIGR